MVKKVLDEEEEKIFFFLKKNSNFIKYGGKKMKLLPLTLYMNASA